MLVQFKWQMEASLGWWVILKHSPKSRSFFISAWYRPPSEPVDIFAKLQQVLSFLDREDKKIILLGDTNCDLFNHALGQSVENNTKHLCDIYE